MRSKIGRLNFDYENPTPNFDRRKVKGVAAQLISLPEEHYNKATALEIAGGSKLFNVVIEDEKVGKELIQNGQMKKRVTFIPLTKISAHTLSQTVRLAGSFYSYVRITNVIGHRNSIMPLNSPLVKFEQRSLSLVTRKKFPKQLHIFSVIPWSATMLILPRKSHLLKK